MHIFALATEAQQWLADNLKSVGNADARMPLEEASAVGSGGGESSQRLARPDGTAPNNANTAGTLTGPGSILGDKDGDDADDDARAEERTRLLIANASAAARVTFPTCPRSASRGQWNYVVGLVGKPSAGKSTFFNAVTKPASEVEAAKVCGSNLAC